MCCADLIPSQTAGEESDSILRDVDDDDLWLEDSGHCSRQHFGFEDPGQGLGLEGLKYGIFR